MYSWSAGYKYVKSILSFHFLVPFAMLSGIVALVKRIPLSATIFQQLTHCPKNLVLGQLSYLSHGQLIVVDEDDQEHVFGEGRVSPTLTARIRVKNAIAWFRILLSNDVGFAEAYMLNDIECKDLTSLFKIFLLNAGRAHSGWLTMTISGTIASATGSLYRFSNTADQALLNARNHYSLGNEIFAAFLDSTMTYSAPIWLPLDSVDAASDDLEKAQLRKLRYVISAARIKSSDHVLEIGTGWGSFAIEAVKQTRCRITTITASEAQAALARERICQEGLQDQIDVLVCDYRYVPVNRNGSARFDKIVSIEMIEHVGAAYLDTYFGCVDQYLKLDGGIAVFQCITIPEARYAGYISRSDFIQRYIFLGGHLPTTSGLISSIDRASQGQLVVEDVKSVSGHYARALREWRENFGRNWETEIRPSLSVDAKMSTEDMEIFRRKWSTLR